MESRDIIPSFSGARDQTECSACQDCSCFCPWSLAEGGKRNWGYCQHRRWHCPLPRQAESPVYLCIFSMHRQLTTVLLSMDKWMPISLSWCVLMFWDKILPCSAGWPQTPDFSASACPVTAVLFTCPTLSVWRGQAGCGSQSGLHWGVKSCWIEAGRRCGQMGHCMGTTVWDG